MSNSIVPISGPAEAQAMGKILASSGMFGCENEAQGAVLAITCYTEGISPLQFKRSYHLVDGNPAMRADAMLAEFRKAGGRYKVIERDSKVASMAVWSVNDDDGIPSTEDDAITWTYTWEDACLSELPYCFKNGQATTKLKKNWRTIPKNMLWARCTSDMVRTLMPEIVAGVYTPEEVSDFKQEEAPPAKAPNKRKPKSEPKPEPEPKSEPVIDVEAKVIPPAHVDPPPSNVPTALPKLDGKLAKISECPIADLNEKQVDWLFANGSRIAWWTPGYAEAISARAKELAG